MNRLSRNLFLERFFFGLGPYGKNYFDVLGMEGGGTVGQKGLLTKGTMGKIFRFLNPYFFAVRGESVWGMMGDGEFGYCARGGRGGGYWAGKAYDGRGLFGGS